MMPSFLLFFISLTSVFSQLFPGNSIIDNTQWLDTDGNFIHAHGGQIFEYNSLFYWVGTTQKQQSDGFLSEGINCYSSKNLVDWDFVAEIFHNDNITGYSPPGPYRIERPKVLYNYETKQFVMNFHFDTGSFTLNLVGVAVSSVVCGASSYLWQYGYHPNGNKSYDMGMFQDVNNDNTGYLVYSCDNEYAAISTLTSDYLNTTGIVSTGPRIEGVALFLLNTYYLIGSHLTGWSPNAAVLCLTSNQASDTLVNADWVNCYNPTNSSTTYESQSTFVLRLEDTSNNNYVFMFMADIWNYPNVQNATYLWLPFIFDDNSPKSPPILPYYKTWQIDNFTIGIPS